MYTDAFDECGYRIPIIVNAKNAILYQEKSLKFNFYSEVLRYVFYKTVNMATNTFLSEIIIRLNVIAIYAIGLKKIQEQQDITRNITKYS